jgi:hypothetical protein
MDEHMDEHRRRQEDQDGCPREDVVSLRHYFETLFREHRREHDLIDKALTKAEQTVWRIIVCNIIVDAVVVIALLFLLARGKA